MKHYGGTEIFKDALRAVLILICAAIFVPSMPVNYFTATGRERLLFSCPVPNGYPFVTTYIHSLELTPVRDDYRFVSGRVWGWEEWTRSLNAGLPSVPSPHTRLVMSDEWMITRGGRRARDVIHYRIGTGEFGRNIWQLEPWREINIFEKYPRYRVALEASVVPFGQAKLSGFDMIHGQPNASPRIFSM
ncbi:MAG: DUF1850 domain-containing protein [Synergistaceae bacterium]|nr:DUF1850 domain-containing protein [Synergistaceae bacterium]